MLAMTLFRSHWDASRMPTPFLLGPRGVSLNFDRLDFHSLVGPGFKKERPLRAA